MAERDLTPDPERIVVGLGHPRCGTGFAANLLAASGIEVGHERLGRDGIVSWMLVSEREAVPWGDALGPLGGYRRIFCVARGPLAAIPSIIAENRKRRSLKFRNKVALERTGAAIGAETDDPREQVALAVASYVIWYEMALALKPGFVFRIEKGVDDAALSDFVGQRVERSENIARNARPHTRHEGFSVSDLGAVDPHMLDRMALMAARLGYPDDAEAIAGLTAGQAPGRAFAGGN